MEKNKISTICTETSENLEGKFDTDHNSLISVKDDKEHAAKMAKLTLEQNIGLVAEQMKVSRELANKLKVQYLYIK